MNVLGFSAVGASPAGSAVSSPSVAVDVEVGSSVVAGASSAGAEQLTSVAVQSAIAIRMLMNFFITYDPPQILMNSYFLPF